MPGFALRCLRSYSRTCRQIKTAAIPLFERKYFEVSGKDSRKFLQGLVTNDVNTLTEYGNSLACGVLNPKVNIPVHHKNCCWNNTNILLGANVE